MLEQTFSALGRQGIGKDTYLKIAGKDEEELAHEAEPDAAAALRREAVLAAVVAAEEIEPCDEELLTALTSAAERDGSDPADLMERCEGRAPGGAAPGRGHDPGGRVDRG